jgi:hypothetical protein
MEGFWTVSFKGVQGWGTGVVTLIAGRVFGGDSAVYFTGTYTQQDDVVEIQIHVKQQMPGLMNVMGRSEFDLDLTGDLQGNTLKIAGNIPGTELRLTATMKKLCDLPSST